MFKYIFAKMATKPDPMTVRHWNQSKEPLTRYWLKKSWQKSHSSLLPDLVSHCQLLCDCSWRTLLHPYSDDVELLTFWLLEKSFQDLDNWFQYDVLMDITIKDVGCTNSLFDFFSQKWSRSTFSSKLVLYTLWRKTSIIHCQLKLPYYLHNSTFLYQSSCIPKHLSLHWEMFLQIQALSHHSSIQKICFWVLGQTQW